MDWKNIYQSKVVSAEKALSCVKSGDYVVPSHAAGEPGFLIKKLVERKNELEDVKIVQGLNVGNAPYAAPECEGSFKVISFFLGKNNRKCIQDGRGEFMPIHFCAQPRAFAERIPIDVVLIQCTPPDQNGYVNMGLSCDQTRVIVEKGKIVIAQVNAKFPYVCGDTLIHVSEIDYFVEYDEEVLEIPQIHSDDPIAEKIGYNISTLIQDGATLQVGQGNIPNAILKYLGDKKDLGVHTEVFTDNLIPLIRSGVVNGKRKVLDRGKVVATFIQGTKTLYDFIDHNDMINLKPVDYTNHPGIISQNNNVVAINSAIQVDLMGQVVADSIGRKTFSGVGGQQDFLRGAEQSKGGLPIIALPSTAKNDTVSRIVAVLERGTPVTTTRQDVHYVVTEYGIANLFGKYIRERAEALISIAHPKFRERLRAEFKEYYDSIGD